MSTPRWQSLERIFAEARELPASDRVAFVTRESGTDASLREAALALLTADDESGEFMAQPALERLARSVAADGGVLRSGERIGAYTIDRMLGSGGAGEVWRARDDRLDRDVAIKVLRPHLSSDRQRLRQFADEARAVGALNHPNILTVYDVGEHAGMPFLVAECLEGKSLRLRLTEGRMAVAEAARIAAGVAHGLAAAHARGIVHRDLKPENIFLRASGDPKLLDFGVAKLTQNDVDANQSITGAIVGTAGYMAPEQIKGETVDARADLFALGVTLYEMLAGRHPFRGESTFETLHAILTRDPPELSANDVPEALVQIVLRLLQKSKDARFQSAADLAWSLAHLPTAVAGVQRTALDERATRGRKSRKLLALGVPTFAAAAVAAAWLLRDTAQIGALEATRFTWTLPDGMTLESAPAVSPNGRHIAFVGKNETGSRLLVRDLGSLEARVVAATDGARQPFWSADSSSLGFFAAGKLMKIALPNGAPVAVADVLEPRGGAWSHTDTIVFAPDVINSGLHRVNADGGSVEPATLLDPRVGDAHRWPVFLPDGIHLLYFTRPTDDSRVGVYVGRADGVPSPATAPLFYSESNAVFAPVQGSDEGVLFTVLGREVHVRRFDTERRTVGPDVRLLGLSAADGTLYQPAMLSASADVLAFAQSSIPAGNRLELVARDGGRVRLWDEPEAQNWPRVSPDGVHLARQRVDPLRNNPDIWVEDLERGTRVRVTSGVEPDLQFVWSPDGRQLAYVSGNLPRRAGPSRSLRIAAADGTGVVKTFPCPGDYCEPSDWSADGRFLLVNVIHAGAADVWAITAEDGVSRPILDAPFAERDARFAPRGAWVAYVDEESGRPEVSVRSTSGEPKRFIVSAGGGAQPVWRRDARELFFVGPDGNLRSVAVNWIDEEIVDFESPRVMDVPPIGFGHWGTQYDVSRDGSQFFLLRRNDELGPREIHVVVGWRALLD
jgi:Tol biopolymer transport system component